MARVSPRTLDRIREAADEIAGPLGLSVERVEFVSEAGNRYLRLTVNREGGVGIRDCERLHRPLSKRLDQMDPIPESYFLEVCSPGTEAREEAADDEDQGARPEGGTA